MKEPIDIQQSGPALARFAAVSWIQQALGAGMSLRESCLQAAQLCWKERYYSARTLEGWYYDYLHKGFGQLANKPRTDAGKSRVLSEEQAAAVLALHRAEPRLSVKAVVRHLLEKGVLLEGGFSMASIYRLLDAAGGQKALAALAAGSPPGISGGPTKAFEFANPNALWMCDVMDGVWLKPQNGAKAVATYLIATLDDHSRLCPHGQYYEDQKLRSLLDCLKTAFSRRGIPDKLYCDQGAIFRSTHLAIVCANLGIRLIHAKPYAAWSKGKIERFFQTVQSDFHARLHLEPAGNLEELNLRFLQWLEVDYHRKAHRGIDGQTPAQRFFDGSEFAQREFKGNWEALFYTRVRRRVRLDATVSLEGQLWEVPVALRGLEIELRYDPFSENGPREIWYGKEQIGLAQRCDKELNARTFNPRDYERRD